ncbi:MAG: nitroreductase [Alphaproteobacteria bacterium]|nr:nitroreductase [Alphaproteobacteria bacterium]MCD8571168.1 nitroreductase [Alphaproteobacteria bacterium]
MTLITAKKSDEVLEYLLRRRSASVKAMTEPGPSSAQIDIILQAASRVPDHGKVVPFHFVVFEGEARDDIGKFIADIFTKKNPGADENMIQKERGRFTRAPLVIGVISRTRPAKHPQWEQVMTAGAVCQNMLLAASSLGYGAQWLSEWYAYDDDVKAALGLDKRDNVAGFIHIGTPAEMPIERERPALDEIVTRWQPDVSLNKGDAVYDRDKFKAPLS